MDDYLAKPVRPRVLEELLDRWLGVADLAPEVGAEVWPDPADTGGALDMGQFEGLSELGAFSGDPVSLAGLRNSGGSPPCVGG